MCGILFCFPALFFHTLPLPAAIMYYGAGVFTSLPECLLHYCSEEQGMHCVDLALIRCLKHNWGEWPGLNRTLTVTVKNSLGEKYASK
jgi:hypothetical protein